MGLYNGGNVLIDPLRLNRSPNDCQKVKALSDLKVGDKVYLTRTDQYYSEMIVRALDKAPYASSDEGFAAFLVDSDGGVIATSFFNANALQEMQILLNKEKGHP